MSELVPSKRVVCLQLIWSCIAQRFAVSNLRPRGLASAVGFVFGSIPFMLKERISYEALAVFSFAGWPYSIKLFVAPIVDSVYSTKIGRRKVRACRTNFPF